MIIENCVQRYNQSSSSLPWSQKRDNALCHWFVRELEKGFFRDYSFSYLFEVDLNILVSEGSENTHTHRSLSSTTTITTTTVSNPMLGYRSPPDSSALFPV